jgi:hypothetical protein
MCPAPSLPRSPLRLVAIALIAVFAGQSFFCSGIKNSTSDEPAGIAAGVSYLETGTVREIVGQAQADAGLYAVSAHWGARIPTLPARESPGTVHCLARAQPISIVGRSIYRYDIQK